MTVKERSCTIRQVQQKGSTSLTILFKMIAIILYFEICVIIQPQNAKLIYNSPSVWPPTLVYTDSLMSYK